MWRIVKIGNEYALEQHTNGEYATREVAKKALEILRGLNCVCVEDNTGIALSEFAKKFKHNEKLNRIRNNSRTKAIYRLTK